MLKCIFGLPNAFSLVFYIEYVLQNCYILKLEKHVLNFYSIDWTSIFFQFFSFQIIFLQFPPLTFPRGKYIIPNGNSQRKLCIRLLFTEIRSSLTGLANELLND